MNTILTETPFPAECQIQLSDGSIVLISPAFEPDGIQVRTLRNGELGARVLFIPLDNIELFCSDVRRVAAQASEFLKGRE